MNRPAEAIKNSANRLAQCLSSGNDDDLLQLMFGSAPSHNGFGADEVEPSDSFSRDQVGIWEKRVERGLTCWVRKPNSDPWKFWSNVERIEQKGSRRRVVLIGESVARGFFYDPRFNPAGALQSIMNSACGGEAVEVVDLARLDLDMRGLLRLVAESKALQPDAYVILAGNNWQPFRAKGELMQGVAGFVRRGCLREARTYLDDELRLQVLSLLKALRDPAEADRVPIIFMLPEFNLADWTNRINAQPLLLDQHVSADWLSIRLRAEQALARGEYDLAAELATQMMELDGGSIPVGPEILAHARRQAGDLDRARRSLELAKDAGLFQFAASPRCFSIIQETLRAEAAHYDIRLVDLPRRFHEYLEGELPGRRLFHDYCHLTAEGVSVAMASAAEHLLPIFGEPPQPWSVLYEGRPQLEPRALAQAHFLAALHNANWGQGYDIVHYHCSEALRISKEIAQSMQLYLDCCTRRTPSIFCDSFAHLAQKHTANFIKFLFDDPRNGKTPAFVLIQALADALSAHLPRVRDQVTLRLLEEYPGEINLLESGCLQSPLDTEKAWRERSASFKALDIKSKFRLVAKGAQALRLGISYRTPFAAPDEKVVLTVNGTAVARLNASVDWLSASADIPKDVLNHGLNSVQILWPLPDAGLEGDLRRRADALASGNIAEAYPVFGELFTLTATLLEPSANGKL